VFSSIRKLSTYFYSEKGREVRFQLKDRMYFCCIEDGRLITVWFMSVPRGHRGMVVGNASAGYCVTKFSGIWLYLVAFLAKKGELDV